MSYFKAKMHQIRFRLGLRPRPLVGEGSGEEGRGEQGRGGKGRERTTLRTHCREFLATPLIVVES